MSSEQQKREWFEINAPLGRALGYPDCCIKAFCDEPPELLKSKKVTDEDRIRVDAAYVNGAYTGFIPCLSHARQIKNGEITLASLIKNRSNEFPPFPDYAPFDPLEDYKLNWVAIGSAAALGILLGIALRKIV